MKQEFTANATGAWLTPYTGGTYLVKLYVNTGSFAGAITADIANAKATPDGICATALNLTAVGANNIITLPPGQVIRFVKGGTALAGGVTATVEMHLIEPVFPL